jgi:phage shock protein PspC (stress-responsive transcriptional regulator)
MLKFILSSTLLLAYAVATACEVCKKQQPKVLRGITHGAGPQSDWDYVIVGVITVVVVITLFYSIKWLVKPGEEEISHIKNSILNPEEA